MGEAPTIRDVAARAEASAATSNAANHPLEEFASVSWRLLMRRFSGEAPNEVERIELPCTLEVRESTGPARQRLEAVAEAHS